ncbi:hypothetical protein M514_06545 [Trichuris suis]|uniref:Uncharacterized protein n=1 Tax=Trichuris suis TaxID=68888 RepID=A0A085M5L5_9BILA|nr:hypothetical protein M513_06545 [Trichuris suis]KFD65231.1 hypothetical protein M514_06545 [Trichuris suis]
MSSFSLILTKIVAQLRTWTAIKNAMVAGDTAENQLNLVGALASKATTWPNASVAGKQRCKRAEPTTMTHRQPKVYPQLDAIVAKTQAVQQAKVTTAILTERQVSKLAPGPSVPTQNFANNKHSRRTNNPHRAHSGGDRLPTQTLLPHELPT